MENLIIGISGRSGCGKTTIVSKLLDFYGPKVISLHTMDNYYLPREMQVRDEDEYLNFDLPSSFYREKFIGDLEKLKNGSDIELEEYVFNNQAEARKLFIPARPIIIVEGLFIYFYPEIQVLMDLSVLIDVPVEEAFNRRLRRDLTERNYDKVEIKHRYHRHAEPAYKKYIEPFFTKVDMVVRNSENADKPFKKIKTRIQQILDHRNMPI